MAMLRPASEMKDSGIEWVGQVPSNWKVVKNNRLFRITKTLVDEAWETTQLLSLTKGGIIEKDINDGSGKQPESFSTYQFVEKDDIVLCLFDIDVSAVFSDRSSFNGMISPAYRVMKCEKNILPVYAKWWFDAVNVGRYYLIYTKSLRKTIDSEGFGNILTAIPPLEEQQAIADYLDDRCSKIDEIIAEATASIEEYTLYKQAIIAEVTTKGLDRNAPMMNTPYIWMGDIPCHWGLKPFRYILNERNEKNNPVKSEERLSLSIDKGVTLYADKTTNLDRFKDDFTAYKLAYEGDLVMNCMNMIVGASGVSKYFGCVSPVYYTYYDNEPDHITAKYCEYLFRSRMLMRVLHSLGRGILSFDRGEDRVNTCRLKISRNDLRSLVLPVPPLNEQREIVDYLTRYDKRIDALISEKQALIDDLQAYKKSLIYEVVTGKRRVV